MHLPTFGVTRTRKTDRLHRSEPVHGHIHLNRNHLQETMNIDSTQDWIKLIISSAGVSTAINIAWSEWTRHRDKKLRRRNAYLEASSNIEDYVQLCINSIEFECDALNYYAYNSSITNHNGK